MKKQLSDHAFKTEQQPIENKLMRSQTVVENINTNTVKIRSGLRNYSTSSNDSNHSNSISKKTNINKNLQNPRKLYANKLTVPSHNPSSSNNSIASNNSSANGSSNQLLKRNLSGFGRGKFTNGIGSTNKTITDNKPNDGSNKKPIFY